MKFKNLYKNAELFLNKNSIWVLNNLRKFLEIQPF